MRVLVDALTAQEGGGLTYLTQILPAVRKARPDWAWVVLLSSSYQQELIAGLPSGIEAITPDLPAKPPFKRLWYLQRTVPRLLRDGHFDVLFSVAEITCLFSPVPVAALVRNPNFYVPVGFHRRRRDRLAAAVYRLAWMPFVLSTLRRADRLMFVSETFRAQILGRYGLDPSRTTVVYHGLADSFVDRDGHDEPVPDVPPYILCVSTIASHKNYEVLIDGFARVASTPGTARLHLLIAGTIRDRTLHTRLLHRAHQVGVADRVQFLGTVPYEKLPALYRGARAVVLPSGLETFGHPLVEAMASAAPVIAADIPVNHEICGDGARYFPTREPAALAREVLAILSDTALARRMSDHGRLRARSFSWPLTAGRLVEVLEELIGRPSRSTNPLAGA